MSWNPIKEHRKSRYVWVDTLYNWLGLGGSGGGGDVAVLAALLPITRLLLEDLVAFLVNVMSCFTEEDGRIILNRRIAFFIYIYISPFISVSSTSLPTK